MSLREASRALDQFFLETRFIGGAARGDAWLARHGYGFSAAEELIESCRARLNKNQLRLLEFIATGLSYRDIGARIGVSDDAISARMQRIYRRLCLTGCGRAVKACLVTGVKWRVLSKTATVPRTRTQKSLLSGLGVPREMRGSAASRYKRLYKHLGVRNSREAVALGVELDVISTRCAVMWAVNFGK